jgi:ubiquinone/menaquinone biosynthesis C-methylase UbiE
MSRSPEKCVDEFYARTYDAWVPDWPGELDFYRELAGAAMRRGAAVLEVACGTGRIAARLAQEGVNIVGLDRSPEMLEVAREKTRGLERVRWVEADMRAFDLGETFGLVIVPGHSFQHLNTPLDQVACLECIARHLQRDGLLVVHLDHQDVTWLGSLVSDRGGRFEPAGEFRHPTTGRLVRAFRAWSYDRASQTATSQARWQEIGADGQVLESWRSRPVPLHCVFRFEMDHLLARAGFEMEAVFGDFSREPLIDASTEMIWLARRRHA